MTSPDTSEAQAIAKEFNSFTYIISHDLNAPLRAIVEFSKLLTLEHGSKLDEEGNQYIDIIRQSGEKLQSMVGGLLEYSRLNTALQPFRSVDCAHIVASCRTQIQEKLEATGGTLECGELPCVSADAAQLEKLFLALLDNAVKFCAPDRPPLIHITAELHAGVWKFTVKDNGIGIEEEFQPSVFLVFKKLHRDDEYPGIGMGLAMAKKIVEIHGGRISVESVPGQGSTFAFTLPQQEVKT